MACATVPDGATQPGSEASSDRSDDDATAAPEVVIEGTQLLLVRDGERTAVADVPDAELVDAMIRPGTDQPLTILVVTRDAERYELRYLDVVGDEPSPLYGFPFRLQVSQEAADVAGPPPVPVWSPDGDRIAWTETTRQGTRLRTVGWLTYERGSNPSDERADWDLGEVPAGVQLETWEQDEDGTTVLTSRPLEGERWRIRLEADGPVTAGAAVTSG